MGLAGTARVGLMAPATKRHRERDVPDDPKPASAANEQQRRPSPARPPSATVVLAVGMGGAIGTLARYQIGLAWTTPARGFPWATLAINVSGALVLAIVATLVVERWPPTRHVRPLVGIGMCGAYTTWATFMTETALLLRRGSAAAAAVYVAATLGTGLMTTVGGIWLSRLWPKERQGDRHEA